MLPDMKSLFPRKHCKSESNTNSSTEKCTWQLVLEEAETGEAIAVLVGEVETGRFSVDWWFVSLFNLFVTLPWQNDNFPPQFC